MDELLEFILSLSDFKLTPAQFNIMKQFFNTTDVDIDGVLQESLGENLKTHLDQHNVSESDIISIMNYFSIWLTFAANLLAWKKTLEDTWASKKQPDEAFSAEYLLPLIIALCPNKTSTLKLINDKLKPLHELTPNNVIGYFITQIQLAIEYKNNPSQKSEDKNEKMIDEFVFDVFKEIKIHDLVYQIKKKIAVLQKDVRVTIEKLLETMGSYENGIIKNNTLSFTQLIESAKDSQVRIIGDKKLLELIQTYLIVEDLIGTLNRNTLANDAILREFYEKYDANQVSLQPLTQKTSAPVSNSWTMGLYFWADKTPKEAETDLQSLSLIAQKLIGENITSTHSLSNCRSS